MLLDHRVSGRPEPEIIATGKCVLTNCGQTIREGEADETTALKERTDADAKEWFGIMPKQVKRELRVVA